MTTFTGTSGNDVFKGGGKDDIFDMGQGGDDRLNGGGGDDTCNFGGDFTAKDKVNGGAGEDTLVLAGDYSAGLVLGAKTLIGVEEIDVTGRFNYSLVMNDKNVAAGQTLTVGSSDLSSANTFKFDGSAETNGSFAISARFAHAELIGGAGADSFTIGDRLGSSAGGGGGGGDQLTGGGGADQFVFLSLGKAGARPHEITDLANEDVIDVANIDADKFTAGDQAFTLVSQFTHHAGEATLSFNIDTGKTSFLMDINGDAKADYVILLDGDHTDFTDFVL
jgi:Ca2+-binding RTX toxin-like protein